MKTILDRKQIIDDLRTNISQLLDMHNSVNEELAELKEKAEMLESGQFTDKLTGLYNRTFFNRRLEEEFHRARRYGNPLSLVLMEVNNFDKHLDTHGKEAGDYILMQTAKIILNNTRLSDIVFRLDTCKFAIILNDTPEKGANYETERIKKVIEDTRLFTHDFFEQNKTASKQQKGNHNITVSIGLISLMESIKEPNDLFIAAEELLEKAKTADRNNTVGYQQFG
ncbi:MAG: GGDEF domain-containing protein [Calditrichia bacterium]